MNEMSNARFFQKEKNNTGMLNQRQINMYVFFLVFAVS